jgi:hypothetical protein
MATPNKFELEQWGQKAARAYLGGGVPLNTTIAKIASDQNFTREHVDRVVQSANQLTNGYITKKAKDLNKDPRLKFDRADSARIMQKLGGDGRESKRRVSKHAKVLDDLFSMPQRDDLEKTASVNAMNYSMPIDEVRDPYVDQRGPVPDDLGHAFIFDREAAECIAKVASYDHVKIAVDELESVLRQARTDAALLIDVGAFGLAKMAEVIDQQLLNKVHPETIKEWTKHASISKDTAETVCEMVGDRVEKLAVYVPKDAPEMPEAFLVNPDHPLIKVAGELDGTVAKQAAQADIVTKVEGAIVSAKACLRDAAIDQAG